MADQQYALRFPFRPLHWIEGLDDPLGFTVGDIRVTMSACSPYVALSAQPFPSESAAMAFIPQLWGALAWMAVQVGTGFLAQMEIDRVTYTEDPEKAAENLCKSIGLPNTGPVHGIVNGDFPSILPIGKTIRFAICGEGTVSQTLTRTLIEGPLAEGLRAPGARLLYDDQRLRTAVELFCDYHRESSLRSKFLTLVIALEVLTEPRTKHLVALHLLECFKEQVAEGLVTFAEDSDEWHALDALQRELLFRRETSLRSRVRDLVLNGLLHLEPDERDRRARDAVWAYDVRSRLVHDGTIVDPDLSKAHGIARSTLMDLLVARMRHASGG